MTETLRKEFTQKFTTTDDSKPRDSRLEKLEAQQKKIKEEIDKHLTKKKKKEALRLGKEREAERKRDTRRKILIGGTIRAEAEKRLETKSDPELHNLMVQLLDHWLVKEGDRKLFPEIPAQHRKEKVKEKEKATT
ncbi:MAG: hypothetical protein NPIRA03_25670 [Nitrospirales bacterium]|nr:MAG: hypothetical protein NPIRA03_25670 [Nitrospirales bacterium]